MISSHSLAVIIRASGENTLKELIKIVKKQLLPQDKLEILDEEVPFFEKLKHGFQLATKLDRDFTVFIDADILIRSNALHKTRKLIANMNENDLGFGLRVWDRFYNKPKFRGYHVYRTSYLTKAAGFICLKNNQLRPESFVKQKMLDLGYLWKNNLSNYVVGLHDYFQNSNDIYYKYLIRAHRSKDEIKRLKTYFERKKNEPEFKIALLAIENASDIYSIENNKSLYIRSDLPKLKSNVNVNVNYLVIKNLFMRYKYSRLFWKSI